VGNISEEHAAFIVSTDDKNGNKSSEALVNSTKPHDVTSQKTANFEFDSKSRRNKAVSIILPI
jgi:hypothetical protein